MAEPTIRQDNGHTIPLREFIERIADERWLSHMREHEMTRKGAEEAERQHYKAHDREHEFTAEAVKKAEESINRAVETAKAASDKRADEFDKSLVALRDTATQVATRDMLNALDKAWADRLDRSEKENNRRFSDLERGSSLLSGRDHGISASLGLLIAVAGVALGLGVFIHNLVK